MEIFRFTDRHGPIRVLQRIRLWTSSEHELIQKMESSMQLIKKEGKWGETCEAIKPKK